MNSEIKTLLALHGLTPPHTVISEEEVVEWLLDIIEERNDKLKYIANIVDMGAIHFSPNKEIPECGLKLA